MGPVPNKARKKRARYTVEGLICFPQNNMCILSKKVFGFYKNDKINNTFFKNSGYFYVSFITHRIAEDCSVTRVILATQHMQWHSGLSSFLSKRFLIFLIDRGHRVPLFKLSKTSTQRHIGAKVSNGHLKAR